MLVRHPREERVHEVQARLEHALELAEVLDHPRLLLRHDADALDHDDDDHGDEERGNRGDRAVREHGGGDGDEYRDGGFPEHERPPDSLDWAPAFAGVTFILRVVRMRRRACCLPGLRYRAWHPASAARPAP